MTYKDLLAKLPDKVSKAAIRNAGEIADWNVQLHPKTVSSALKHAFDWSNSPEKFEFWKNIHKEQEDAENSN